MNRNITYIVLILMLILSISNLYGSDRKLEKDLYYASRSCKIEKVASLIKKAPSRKALNRALWASLGSRYHTKEDVNCKRVAKFLLKKGADIEMLNRNNQTMVIAFSQLGRQWILDFIIRLGAKVDSVDRGGSQAIHKAAFYGMNENVKILINHGANVNARTKLNQTPIYNASIRGGESQIKTAKTLIKHGADINIQANNGFTPLMHAVMNANFKFADLLIKNGADVNLKNKKGSTVLSIAKAYFNRNKRLGLKNPNRHERAKKYRNYIQVLQNKGAKMGKRFIIAGGV